MCVSLRMLSSFSRTNLVGQCTTHVRAVSETTDAHEDRFHRAGVCLPSKGSTTQKKSYICTTFSSSCPLDKSARPLCTRYSPGAVHLTSLDTWVTTLPSMMLSKTVWT